jgi:hypothetical protein
VSAVTGARGSGYKKIGKGLEIMSCSIIGDTVKVILEQSDKKAKAGPGQRPAKPRRQPCAPPCDAAPFDERIIFPPQDAMGGIHCRVQSPAAGKFQRLIPKHFA